MLDILEQLGVPAPVLTGSAVPVRPPRVGTLILDGSDDPFLCGDYRRLRRREFVETQGLFARDDSDRADADLRTRTLIARDAGGAVLGGVRLHPETERTEIGWWRGSRLVVRADAPGRGAIGAALVRAACATALELGALRFDAHVQRGQHGFFARLGWETIRDLDVAGAPHVLMRWPVQRFAELVAATKAPLGALVGDLLAHDPWRGDDGSPVAGSDVVACVDGITPAMVERDPEWAGWCGMLVTAHDLSAMGAAPVGALDALGAADADHAERVLRGIRRGAEAFSLPVLGGHTQLGMHAALAVTGLGRTADPVPAAGGRPGERLTLTADTEGGWRPGYHGRQWDSSSWRTREQLAAMLAAVGSARPRAAKDVSMAGIVGTTGMLAEACGCGAELEVEAIVRPTDALLADWLTCFPGFAVLTSDATGRPPLPAGPARSVPCGELQSRPGVRLRWPDGEITPALSAGAVSGLGPARALQSDPRGLS